MKGSLFIGRYSGIGVFIHWTFSLLILYFIISGIYRGLSSTQISWTVLFVLSVFMCVVLHEFGHALSARKYGIKTKHITLLPIGGVAQLESLPEKPAHELVVALAGPMVNFIIAALLFPFVMNQEMAPESLAEIHAGNFLVYLFTINIVLAIFNLIPAFPMDGGRVLRALLSFSFGRPRATAIAARLGQFLAFGFVLLGLFSNPFLVLIGIFIFLGAQSENQMVQTQHMLRDYKVSDVMMRDFTILSPEQQLGHVAGLLLNSQQTDFIVKDNDKLCGMLSRDHLIQGIAQYGTEGKVEDAMSKELKMLHHDARLSEVYAAIRMSGNGLHPVMKSGELIGVVDAQNIAEFMLIKSSLEQAEA